MFAADRSVDDEQALRHGPSPPRVSEGNTGELLGIAAGNAPAGVETRELVLATYDASVEALADELRVPAQAVAGRYPATGLLDLGAPNFLRRFMGGKARLS